MSAIQQITRKPIVNLTGTDCERKTLKPSSFPIKKLKINLAEKNQTKVSIAHKERIKL